jgi:hypothetical protein
LLCHRLYEFSTLEYFCHVFRDFLQLAILSVTSKRGMSQNRVLGQIFHGEFEVIHFVSGIDGARDTFKDVQASFSQRLRCIALQNLVNAVFQRAKGRCTHRLTTTFLQSTRIAHKHSAAGTMPGTGATMPMSFTVYTHMCESSAVRKMIDAPQPKHLRRES